MGYASTARWLADELNRLHCTPTPYESLPNDTTRRTLFETLPEPFELGVSWEGVVGQRALLADAGPCDAEIIADTLPRFGQVVELLLELEGATTCLPAEVVDVADVDGDRHFRVRFLEPPPAMSAQVGPAQPNVPAIRSAMGRPA